METFEKVVVSGKLLCEIPCAGPSAEPNMVKIEPWAIDPPGRPGA
jgi:hypothetical protein